MNQNGNISVQEVLRSYGDIIDRLFKAKIVRTRNQPIADIGEYIVMQARGARELEKNSNKSFDLIDSNGKKVQVKCRVAPKNPKVGYKSTTFSAFRGFDFDYCIFLVFDCQDFSIGIAREVDKSVVQSNCNNSEHTNSKTITISKISKLGKDVKSEMEVAYKEMEVKDYSKVQPPA